MSSLVDFTMEMKGTSNAVTCKESAKQSLDGGNRLQIQKERKSMAINLMDCGVEASPKFYQLYSKKGLLSPLSVSRDLDFS